MVKKLLAGFLTCFRDCIFLPCECVCVCMCVCEGRHMERWTPWGTPSPPILSLMLHAVHLKLLKSFHQQEFALPTMSFQRHLNWSSPTHFQIVIVFYLFLYFPGIWKGDAETITEWKIQGQRRKKIQDLTPLLHFHPLFWAPAISCQGHRP